MVTRCRLILAFLCVASTAGAAPKKKPPKAPAAAAEKAPIAVPKANEKAVSELMGPWKWGMTTEEVLAALHRQLSERAAPELGKITDVYEQTRIRKKLLADVDRVRKTRIEFNGQRTGWDVSIIEGEFLHKNGESMLHYRETDPATGREQQRFFFFVGDKLWKQFVAFNMEPYKGKTFADFRAAMEARYGQGAEVKKADRDGKEKVVAVAWRAGDTYLRAIDLMKFYANFCLAFSSAPVEDRMAQERAIRFPAPPPPRATVSAPEEKLHDPNADVVERIIAK